MDKLDETLRARIAEPSAAAQSVPVIVTLAEGADPAALAACGLTIERRFAAIGAVAGRIAVADLPRLAGRAEVARIEHDGEVRALDRP
jgi:hypothetical protein